MKQYVGLDVSQRETTVCVVDQAGRTVYEGRAKVDGGAPRTPSATMGRHPMYGAHRSRDRGDSELALARAQARGCSSCRHRCRAAYAGLSVHINKSDQNDARGLAELVRVGWYGGVKVKSEESQRKSAPCLLLGRVWSAFAEDIKNQVRSADPGVWAAVPKKRSACSSGARSSNWWPRIINFVLSSIHCCRSHEHVCRQQTGFDDEVPPISKGRRDDTSSMTVPSGGMITALTFRHTIDDPSRFRSASKVSAYLSLTPPTQSIEQGRPEQGGFRVGGDRLLRTYLFKAATVFAFVAPRNGGPSRAGE